MTLHLREVDNAAKLCDGDQPLQLPMGWSIADGSPDDVRVCSEHPWQSACLVFADGSYCGTAACDADFRKGDQSLGQLPLRRMVRILFRVSNFVRK